MVALAAGYVLGCGWRSFLPVFDVPRIVMVDSFWSSVIVGRSVATVAELCFAAQWALLLRAASRATGSTHGLRLSRLVLPLIESARGVLNLAAVAAAPGVQRLAFGTLDYAVDLDLSGDERGLIVPATQIALASRCAGLGSPIYGVTPAIGDELQLLADLEFGRAFGFGAKLCIHPKQVAAIHRALQPTAAEIDWARRVLAVAEGGEGAAQLDGKMVDRPVVLKAHAILSRASQ